MLKQQLNLLKTVTLTLIILTGSTACLKTRSQLREDESAPQSVQAVEPKGGYAVDELKQEIVRLTGRIEELEHDKVSDSKKRSKGR